MKTITKTSDTIYRLTLPYKDIFTTVYTVRTNEGVLLFDAASYDTDIEHIKEFLAQAGVSRDELKYVFISHNHTDHAGGLNAFIKEYPDVCIISRCPRLREKFADHKFITPEDGDTFLDVLKTVTVPGHTSDATAILDTRTMTLISGDGLQLYGIFGSGNWGANISLVRQHLDALEKLGLLGIEHILTAHDYHPLGYRYDGKDQVRKALDSCSAPLLKVKAMIEEAPHLSDEEICAMYNAPKTLPTMGIHVVAAVRRDLVKQ